MHTVLAQPTALLAEIENSEVVAHLYGEPVFKVPKDLYIPPDALEVFLDAFEGPLDLLLYLIRKQDFNILDIPMAVVTHQYLEYVEEIRSRNLELASEYLLMAAMLIEIKSRMLLPPKKIDNGQETEDPRAELVRRLRDYEQIKLAAQQLQTLPQVDCDFFCAEIGIPTAKASLPRVSAEALQQAWLDVVQRARLMQRHQIQREELSVREHMSHILKTLQRKRFIQFEDLFNHASDIAVVVVNFVALLELSKETLVDITQAEAYAPIYVRLAFHQKIK